jgi:exopolyphosphatase/pppGpp-phosphohydrolase
MLQFVTVTPVSSSATTQSPVPVCAIDMGSNTFRRIVGRFAAGRYEQNTIERKTVGVGDDVRRNGRISDAKLAEIRIALADFKRACSREGAAPVLAIGTAAFREARNGRQVVEIARRLGIPMEIATEKRESALAYLVGSLGRDGYAVVDNGSRSVELVASERGELRYTVFTLGYRPAYESFFAKADDPAVATSALRERLRAKAAKAPFMKGKKKLVGLEFGEMAEILFGAADVEGRVFTLARSPAPVASGPASRSSSRLDDETTRPTIRR